MNKIMMAGLLCVMSSGINGMDKQGDKTGFDKKMVITGPNTCGKTTLKNISLEKLRVMGDDRQKSVDARIWLPLRGQHTRQTIDQDEAGFIAFAQEYVGKRK